MKIILLATAALSLGASPKFATAQVADLQAAHIEANVPPSEVFDAFLTRDLTTFFSARGLVNPRVTFVLLRDGPTQSGVSWPKYYAWVTVSSDGSIPISGAVRVAAIDRVRFEVTDFLRRNEILNDADNVGGVFPAALTPDILRRASDR